MAEEFQEQVHSLQGFEIQKREKHRVCFQFLFWEAVLKSARCWQKSIICSKTQLDGTTREQTIICRQLFAGHVVGS